MSATVNVILQKLCTILSFLQQLLSVERLSDSCIVQLVRTSLQTLLVDNIQLLQLKAISLIGGVMRLSHLATSKEKKKKRKKEILILLFGLVYI